MSVAMRHGEPDRVPVMCQLSLGHYFLHSGLDPVEVWHDSRVFAEALLRLQARYGFDGILVNLPGRDPDWRRLVERVETRGRDRQLLWTSGRVSVCPPDDNPHVFLADRRTRPLLLLDELARLRPAYLEPHGLLGVEPLAPPFPAWHWDALRQVRARAPDVSVHGEVFSPFSQLCEAIGLEECLVALHAEPDRLREALGSLCAGTVELMAGHVAAGADAVLISSAYTGGGLISSGHYRDFVLPCEAAVIAAFRSRCPGTPVYTHTCGAIGDRLELLAETGTDGIDTLDPPPLGNVELAEAKRRVGGRLFLKGNVDPVGTVLQGSAADVLADARRRIAIGRVGGGYVLSTACSVPPAAPPDNVRQLRAAVEAAAR
jgi:hypothetical protein